MARPEKIKTELGQRLTDLRKLFGYPERRGFAQLLQVSKDTLGNYERGDREPDLKFLCFYVNHFGVNLHWLGTGEGDMFKEPGKAPANVKMIEASIMEHIAESVEDILKAANHSPTIATITRLSVRIYNNLLKNGTDFDDKDELTAAVKLESVKSKKNLSSLL